MIPSLLSIVSNRVLLLQKTKMLFLISLATVLSTVSALISRDSETSGSENKDLRILPLGGKLIEIRK